MLRTLTKEELELVSGGTRTDPTFCQQTFDNWSQFDNWFSDIDFDLRSLSDFGVTIDIYDGDGFDVSAYANFGISNDNLTFNGAGITITMEF